MTYAQLDDTFDDDPKYANAELEDMGLIAAGITYAHRHLTDGRIPRSWPRRRWGKAGEHAVTSLLRDGIWAERSDGDLEIVGFLDRYPSRAEVLEQRALSAEVKAKAGRAGGLKSGEVRRAKARAEAAARSRNGEADAKQTGSRPEANGKQNEALSDPIRSNPRERDARANGASPQRDERPFAMPDHFPLTPEARAEAEAIGVRAVDDEWAKFRARQIRDGKAFTSRQWLMGGWPKWCHDAKAFERHEPGVDAPFHAEANLPPRPPAQVSAAELEGATKLAEVLSLHAPTSKGCA